MSSEIELSKGLAKEHYENFPVASFLLHKTIRSDVALYYRFAREADDMADEGILSATERTDKLNQYENDLRDALAGSSIKAFHIALAKSIQTHSINPQHFYDLISAFKQDVVKTRYINFDEILDYCNRSANPVGRILLELYSIHSEEAVKFSDAICTALQLTNFYQDISRDVEKGRIYFALDEIAQFSANEHDILEKKATQSILELIEFNVERADTMFEQGEGLFNYLSGRFKLEIKWTVKGGREILRKIRHQNYDTLNKRPKLTKLDFVFLFLKGLV